METGKAYTDAIIVGERLRQADEAKVASLAESMSAIGLQQPISVWVEDDAHLHLVAGLHRVLAARKLGWPEIACILVELDEIDRQLWEIDENLMRAELSPGQEAEHLARRATLWGVRISKQNSGTSCPEKETSNTGRPEGFASDTAKKTGKSKRDINRSVKRGRDIDPEVLALATAEGLDTGKFLDRLAGMDSADEQMDVVQAAIRERDDRDALKRRREEQKQRDAEAKEARKAALYAALELLVDYLPQAKWDELIRRVDDAGGSISSKSMRSHMAPAR